MTGSRAFIAVIEDDSSCREALVALLASRGLCCEAFASATDFLQSGRLSRSSCLVVDLQMPGMNGFELQSHPDVVAHAAPIVFVTAHADAKVRARAIAAGAVALMPKPFDSEALVRCLWAATHGSASAGQAASVASGNMAANGERQDDGKRSSTKV